MDVDRSSDHDRTSLVFSVRGPIPIHLDEHGSTSSSSSLWSSGASVLDLVFPQAESVSEIRLRNWYTARLTLLVRFDDSVQAAPKREHLAWAAAASLSLARLRGVDSTEGIKIGRNLTNSKSLADWVVSLQSRQLMPDPHSELGSQDTVVISASESLVPLHDITALRFLLRQPSPNWKTFSIEDIAVYSHPLLPKSALSATAPPNLDDLYENPGRRGRVFRGRSSGGNSGPSPSVVDEVTLEALAAQTKEAITGPIPTKRGGGAADKDKGGGGGDGEQKDNDEDATVGLLAPTAYDVMSLQLN